MAESSSEKVTPPCTRPPALKCCGPISRRMLQPSLSRFTSSRPSASVKGLMRLRRMSRVLGCSLMELLPQMPGVSEQVGKGSTRLRRGARLILLRPRAAASLAAGLSTAATGTAGLIAHAHGQADALARYVHLQHPDLDDIPGLDHIPRVLDEGLAEHGNMHQTILVHADIDEGTEVGHVADHPLEHHAGLEVADLLHPFLEGRRLELGTRVAAGLVQLGENVGDGRDTEALVGEAGRVEPAQEGRIADQAAHV